ncbi:MAG: GNAT family N-acetyltransferase [Chloroflexota bacterium]|jgi:ribosomal protein S18 acetylase RimI-like enzyme
MEITLVSQVSDEIMAAFQHLLPQLSSSAIIPSLAEIQEIASNESLFIARDTEQDGKIIGTLTLVTFRIPTGVRSWIEDVVVDESARGKGVGEALTRAALQRARELGAITVDLTSRPTREAANRLYQRVGFELRHTNLYRYDL